MNKSRAKHWDAIFSSTEPSKLGWYEKDLSQTLKLLKLIPKWEESTIFLPGAGVSGLIESLLSSGAKLVLNDISIEALNLVKNRLGAESKNIKWLCQDIAQAINSKIPDLDIWLDRAVLHFLTDEDEIKNYFNNVKTSLKTGGHAIFAEFSKTGAPKCAGLSLHRYSVTEISGRLGDSFRLVTDFEYIYINPSGDPRPYIYTLYKREK